MPSSQGPQGDVPPDPPRPDPPVPPCPDVPDVPVPPEPPVPPVPPPPPVPPEPPEPAPPSARGAFGFPSASSVESPQPASAPTARMPRNQFVMLGERISTSPAPRRQKTSTNRVRNSATLSSLWPSFRVTLYHETDIRGVGASAEAHDALSCPAYRRNVTARQLFAGLLADRQQRFEIRLELRANRRG